MREKSVETKNESNLKAEKGKERDLSADLLEISSPLML